jgi:hypothetical protein
MRNFKIVALFTFIMMSCQEEGVIPTPDLRADLVNFTFKGIMGIDNNYTTESTFQFMRGGIRNPYYLVNLNYGSQTGSGLIEILKDNSFLISINVGEKDFSGVGNLSGDTVSIFAMSTQTDTNKQNESLKFKGFRVL